jgi:hypothetical protein
MIVTTASVALTQSGQSGGILTTPQTLSAVSLVWRALVGFVLELADLRDATGVATALELRAQPDLDQVVDGAIAQKVSRET